MNMVLFDSIMDNIEDYNGACLFVNGIRIWLTNVRVTTNMSGFNIIDIHNDYIVVSVHFDKIETLRLIDGDTAIYKDVFTYKKEQEV